MPSTVTKKQTKANPKKSISTSSQKQKHNNKPSSTDSDSSDSKQTSKKPNRRHHHKRKSAQPKLQTTPTTNTTNTLQVETRRRTRSNSAVDYAGPQFMYCSPSPTSLPKPPVVESKHPKPIQSISLDIRQTQKQQPTLYEKSLHQQNVSSKPYVIDPITDIQEKLRILLKLQ